MAASTTMSATDMHLWIEHVAAAAELAGVAVLAGGMLLAAARFALAPAPGESRYERCRIELARAILLGLEILVAADIVRTVALTPSMQGLAGLAAIVAIRTLISWTLALELTGRWPWQGPRDRSTAASTT